MNKRIRFMLMFFVLIVIFFGGLELFRYLNGSDDEEESLVPVVQEEDEIKEDEPKTEVRIYKFTTEFLNLRVGPSTTDEIILTIPKGDKVQFISSENGWDKIIYDDSIGYSSNEYLSEPHTEEVYLDDDELEIVVSSETMKIVNGILLVNKEYALSMDYAPGEDPEAKEHLDRMFAAFYDETGKGLTAYSGYRTYDYQKGLFDRYVEKDGYDNAVMYSAKPRHSEHETGLAFDIGGADQAYWLEETFEDTEEGIWLRENAHRFGYILRYPKGKTHITGYIYEPWHFRYIGIEHASNIYDMDITLEEYLLD